MGLGNKYVRHNCKCCGKSFHLRDNISKDREYCSIKCAKNPENDYKRKCDYCGKTFYKPEKEVNGDTEKKIYCSERCSKNKRKYTVRKELRESYIVKLINNSVNIESNDIPQELIELKRLNIKRKRIIKKRKTHGNSQ